MKSTLIRVPRTQGFPLSRSGREMIQGSSIDRHDCTQRPTVSFEHLRQLFGERSTHACSLPRLRYQRLNIRGACAARESELLSLRFGAGAAPLKQHQRSLRTIAMEHFPRR
jgi:hypothetical protein